ncbi:MULTISPECIES: hypothetical protein [unclassified Micrococcus]|uniref:hypothetical protein n=1 Tax=unclassified Micrococcus TaxID=2620948 RepID=UPI002005A513|nr:MULTISPECIES: hypothetical protein [unclassified Micrococcus]MCK6096204.1 hypothetical protein [Micrococcus sp. EYE_212]
MTAGVPGAMPGPGANAARDALIQRRIADGYARQAATREAEHERAQAETPAERAARVKDQYAEQLDRAAEQKRATRAWEAVHGPTPTGLPERAPGSVERGRALWADQQRKHA